MQSGIHSFTQSVVSKTYYVSAEGRPGPCPVALLFLGKRGIKKTARWPVSPHSCEDSVRDPELTANLMGFDLPGREARAQASGTRQRKLYGQLVGTECAKERKLLLQQSWGAEVAGA
jgi:hypothetical protein